MMLRIAFCFGRPFFTPSQGLSPPRDRPLSPNPTQHLCAAGRVERFRVSSARSGRALGALQAYPSDRHDDCRNRKHVRLKRADPLRRVLLVLPVRSMGSMDARAASWNVGAVLRALLRSAIGSPPSRAILRSLAASSRASASETSEIPPQPDVGATAMNDGAQYPAFRARLVDDECKPISVAITPGLFDAIAP